MRVLLAGGGTAGHIEPALATADALRRLDPDVSITMLGTSRGLETTLVPARGYALELIPPVPLPRRLSLDLVRVPSRVRAAVHATEGVLDRSPTDAVVGFGGYVALPAYLAARHRHLPLVVHEANARPGLANRVGARFAKAVAVASPSARLRRAVHIGMPLRQAVATLDRAAARDDACADWGLQPDRAVLLVFGGSQGARRLNTAVATAAVRLVGSGVQVLHVTGTNNVDDVRRIVDGVISPADYVVVPYVEQMALAYAAADLAVCRAGAMTVAELTAVGLPAVYVPLPIGNGEQRLNAAPVVEAGGGVMVDDADVDADRLHALVDPLIRDPQRLATMSAAAARLGSRDADEKLARLIIDVVNNASAA